MKENNNYIIIFKTKDDKISVDVRFDEETAWLNLDQMTELFERDKSTISRHIKNVFEEGELDRNSVVANFATTAADGKTYQVDYYNLDVIISVGYRVKSLRGTQFRQWATRRLNEYIRKGFALDDERLKNGGGRYFRELLQRIRDIRSSERNLYQQVTESTPQRLTTIQKPISRESSSLLCRIKCTTPRTDTQQRKLFTSA
jgi:hypothetical protein